MADNIKVSEVSDILKMQLQGIDTSVQFDEVGTVLQVSDGVARIYGLKNAEANELLEFDNGVKAIAMYQGYGLSEATPIISSNSQHKHKLGSSGSLVVPMELKICDSEGRILPHFEKGEIVIKGENVMAGYYKNEKATAETIRDGWLHTGDMGYMIVKCLPERRVSRNATGHSYLFDSRIFRRLS